MAYIGNEPSQASQRIVTSSTATASQTVFNASSGYSLGYIDVYQNGTKLVNGDDYTAADGTSITLTTGALVGDSVELVAFIPRGLTDGYLKSEADAKYLTIASPSYTGTLTGGTGVVNLGSGQFYKDASGNVGIGTSSPTCKLDVAVSQNSDTYTRIYNANAGSSARATIIFGNNSTGIAAGILYNSSTNTGMGGGNSLNIYNGLSAPITFETNATEAMRIDSSGNVLVGTTSTTPTNSSVQINSGIVIAGGYRTHNGSSGSTWQNSFNLYWTGSATQLWIDTTNQGTITVVSDYRLKDNVVTQSTSAIDRIQQLRPVTYTYKDYEPFSWKADGINREGFIAHELQEIIPSAVEGEKDAENQIQSLKLDALCSVMVKAIQELKAIVDTQAEQITALNAKVGI